MAHERVDPEHTDPGQRELHLARYNFACKYAQDQDIFDIACGEGFGSFMLANAGCDRVIGVDLDDGTIEKAEKKYRAPNLEFHVGDAQQVLFPERTFDCIVSFETIEHLEFPEKYLYAMTKILKGDGIYICSTPVRVGGLLSDKPKNPFHYREWNLREFRSLLSHHFGEINIYGQSFYFQNTPIPFDRIIMGTLCKLFFRSQFPKLFQSGITDFPGLPESFKCWPQYQVALCKKPIS